MGITQPHVEPSLIPLIKENHGGKSDMYFVKLKLQRDPTSSTSDLCEFKMSLFDNGEPEDLLLFVRNFNMTIAASGTLEADEIFQFLFNIVHGEALYQFSLFSADV